MAIAAPENSISLPDPDQRSGLLNKLGMESSKVGQFPFLFEKAPGDLRISPGAIV